MDSTSKKMELSDEEAKQLFTMYHLYKNSDLVNIDFETFINYSYYLVNNDSETMEIVDEETKNTIIQLKTTYDILINQNTSSELYTKLENANLGGVKLSSIEQLYGIYGYNSLEDKSVDFETMLDFIVLAANTDATVNSIISQTDLTSLTQLSVGVDSFNENMEKTLTKQEFQAYMYQNHQIVLQEQEIAQIYASYFQINQLEETDTIEYLKIMNHMITIGQITDESTIQTLQNYNALYQAIHSRYEYNEFSTALATISYGLTGTVPTVNMNENSLLQIYIMYMVKAGYFTNVKMTGIDFANFTLNQYSVNPIIQSQMTNEDINKLADMKTIYNCVVLDLNSYNYKELSAKLNLLQNSLISIIGSQQMNEDKVSGIYIKYALSNNMNYYDSIMAYELLNFVNQNKSIY